MTIAQITASPTNKINVFRKLVLISKKKLPFTTFTIPAVVFLLKAAICLYEPDEKVTGTFSFMLLLEREVITTAVNKTADAIH